MCMPLGCMVCTFSFFSFLCCVQNSSCIISWCYFYLTACLAEHIVINKHTCIDASKLVIFLFAIHMQCVLIVKRCSVAGYILQGTPIAAANSRRLFKDWS